ncbi:MAG: cytochrome-c peroxidase [Desulfobulbus sp.]|nr:cytochrome-c peroxidase [Desulfobulbus sp.]
MKIAGHTFSVIFFSILLIAVLAWLSLIRREPPEPPQPPAALLGMPGEILQTILPLAPIEGLDPERVALGKRLFHDTRLSADTTISCASCHNLTAGGADGRRFSIGIGGAIGSINAPTVFNSAYNLAQFWDGRAATLEEQAAGPIQNPIELGATWPQILGRLAQDADLVADFGRLYPDGLTTANLLNAIATFERSLITIDSRFDRYLRGDRKALSKQEEDGYWRFLEYGCASCHQGRLIGGNMYQKFGVLGDYFAGRAVTASDLGRYNVTGREEDRYVFKVPSLRNVALTAPYFHDGSAKTLEQAVVVMARYQLGRDLSTADTEAIVAFLHTLNGVLPSSVKP